MPETLQKLRPDRDLQCYFLLPSAIAAMSGASATGFTVSGSWRQQFDWAVIEWNRDNVFEHPMLRNLPDGDLSGLQLYYEETRENCIPLDSSLFHTVDWPSLRVWAESGSTENIYFVPLKDHAAIVAGGYTPPSAVFTLQGSPTAGDYVQVAWLGEHYYYQLKSDGTDTLDSAVQGLGDVIHGQSATMDASYSGAELTLTYLGESATPGIRETLANSTTGANGNRLGAYATVSGANTESWSPAWQYFSGGASPAKWGITLNFGSLRGWLTPDHDSSDPGVIIPTSAVRKLRWTYAADFQAGQYQRSEFQVTLSNWAVTGTGLGYQVAGSESRRVEDVSPDLIYSGAWSQSTPLNFSGGAIHSTSAYGASVSYTYTAAQDHSLYLGTRKADTGTQISIAIDSQTPRTENLLLGEDVLVRILVAQLAGGTQHTVTVTQTGATGVFYFDFFEIAVPVTDLPAIAPNNRVTLATDWDTYHSSALPAERTAWLIKTLGFTGRANHYAGALYFYELVTQGFAYASGTVTFSGTPVFGGPGSEIVVGLSGSETTLQHVNLLGDTVDSVAKAYELILNNGFTGIRAEATGAVLTIYSKSMGLDGNSITLSASPTSGSFQAVASGSLFSGGGDGNWRTDLTAMPRINRAARDWSVAYFTALKSYGIDVVAAFSMELKDGDPDPAAGIAQRYNDGVAVQLNTPAVQTNFSPTSAAFWQQVYLDMANLMAQAGCVPYLQFGEVQWWYFPWDLDQAHPHNSLPFYDAYTTSTFSATYGHAMHVFVDTSELPASHPDEAQFLPGLIGAFTSQIMSFVRLTHANSRFEVLYPPDTNDSPLDRVINLPPQWTAAALDCFKTENFTFTNVMRDMNAAENSILLPMQLGFPASKASHLIGIGDYTSPWLREMRMARAQGVESVVLFALDQFCLIGYAAPLARSRRRSRFMSV